MTKKTETKTETEAKQEWVVGSTKMAPETKIKFIANPKREGSKAHARYEKYSKAKTWKEYMELTDSKFTMADARYDLSKEFLKIVE